MKLPCRLLSLTLILLSSTWITGSVAHAEKMDTETHTLVIEKLEKSLREAKEDETLSLRPVRARLADLYAERARLRAMSEAENNCSDCKGAVQDRERALKLYETVLAESQPESRGAILLQMAHINRILFKNKIARNLYDQIVREGSLKHSRSVLAQGYVGRAELSFGRGDFKEAQTDFETARRLLPLQKQGEIYYRLAWCRLNLGDQPQALAHLIHILKTPELLTRDSGRGSSLDSSFHEDVARDLAIFIARGSVGAREIRLLESLSPERSRLFNLKLLATELERLGAKSVSLQVWESYLRQDPPSFEKLEARVHVARLQLDLGRKPAVLHALKLTLEEWRKLGCAPETECQLLQKKLRQIVVDWNRSEKKKPSLSLLYAYQTYLEFFDRDAEMTYGAALIARELKRSSDAASLYHKSSEQAAELAPHPENRKLLEASLVGEVEMAEMTQSKNLREAAYDHYLKLHPQGEIAPRIRYQRARIAYERGDNEEATKRLNEFATSEICLKSAPKKTAELCAQAADLDLDALVLLRDDRRVEERASFYARKYPNRRMEYLKITRTAILKQAASMQTDQAIAKLGAADMSGATGDERIRFYKTQMSLAEKSQDLVSVRQSSRALLAVPGLSENDRELALAKQVWLAEMQLDFKEAYRISLRMRMPKLKPEEKAMRLALLAELAGQNPREHEEEFLRLSRHPERRALVQAKLVRSSKSPMATLRMYEKDLTRRPFLYAPLTLEIYAKTGDRGFAESALRVRGVVNEVEGQMLKRQLFLRDFAKIDSSLARHSLRVQSDALLKRTLSDRLRLLEQAEKMAASVVRSRDLTSQIISLSVLARENKRLHEEILALPVPRQIRNNERAQYLRLVESQAKPYEKKQIEIEKKLTLLWGDREFLNALIADYERSRPFMRPLHAYELKRLAAVASTSRRDKIASALEEEREIPTAQTLASARKEVRENPFDSRSLMKLKNLEADLGRETMVTYLDARLVNLRSAGGIQ